MSKQPKDLKVEALRLWHAIASKIPTERMDPPDAKIVNLAIRLTRDALKAA